MRLISNKYLLKVVSALHFTLHSVFRHFTTFQGGGGGGGGVKTNRVSFLFYIFNVGRWGFR